MTHIQPLPRTTPFSCPCDDKQYSDAPGYRCDHMKALADGAAPAEALPSHCTSADFCRDFGACICPAPKPAQAEAPKPKRARKPQPARCACSPDCPIPATTDEQCEHYRTSIAFCTCRDRSNPDRPGHLGSWADPLSGVAICKHIHHRRVSRRPRRRAAA